MRLAYADPPYLGYGSFYDEHHEDSREFDDIDAHKKLIQRLNAEFSDGWAMSMTSGNLHDILPLCPREARIASWVKPFASFKKNVSPAYTWEPVIFVRTRKHSIAEPTVRDHIACNITLRRGLVGAKPDAFCSWILDLLGWERGDEMVDLFPGTGGMDRVVAARAGQSLPGQLELFADLETHSSSTTNKGETP